MTVTPRQRQVAELLALGMTRKQIADALCITPSGVDGHLTRLNRSVGAVNGIQAVAILITEGIIEYRRQP